MENSFGFGERLRKARKEKGWSQSEMGKGAGENGRNASKQSVTDWEKERHYPKADQIRVLCLRLGVTADELIFGDVRAAANLAHAESAISQLTPEQRHALLAKMLGPAVSDEMVELKVPATKQFKKTSVK